MMALNPISQAILTMTSREIAELTGKDHKNVIRDIRTMLDELEKDGSNLSHPQEDKDSRGYTTCFHLNRELTETLLTGYSASARLKVIRRWHDLEEQVPRFEPATLTRMDILKLAMDSEERCIKAEAERDQAVATKHLIGSKREATAMATASAAKHETERLKDRLGINTRHATVKSVEKLTGNKYPWLPLRKWCDANGGVALDVPDPLYGHVKSWPKDAWGEVHAVDLTELFADQR
jgi:phage regulator Rha-like protein